jgi:hypothetical protein
MKCFATFLNPGNSKSSISENSALIEEMNLFGRNCPINQSKPIYFSSQNVESIAVLRFAILSILSLSSVWFGHGWPDPAVGLAVSYANGANGSSKSQLGVLFSLHTSLKKLALKTEKKKAIFLLILQRNILVRNWRAPAGTWPEKGCEGTRQRSHCRARGEEE